MHVARRSLFINLASVAWAFNVTSSVPPEEIDTLAFTSAANSHPLPFPACVGQASVRRMGADVALL